MDQAAEGALTGLSTDERLRAGDLIAELKGLAVQIGPNATPWPGLTVYRSAAHRPAQPGLRRRPGAGGADLRGHPSR